MSEVMNVKLTMATMEETVWHIGLDEKFNKLKIHNDLKPGQYTEVLVSKQLPFVLFARMETGEYFIYDHLRYNKNIPFHMDAFFKKWNHDHGFGTMQ